MVIQDETLKDGGMVELAAVISGGWLNTKDPVESHHLVASPIDVHVNGLMLLTSTQALGRTWRGVTAVKRG